MAATKTYWEKQGGDRLCAVHTLNCLVQGPVFSEVQLGSIANQLDAQEKQLLGVTSTDSNWESQNASIDGNFSLPVLEETLKSHGMMGVSLVNMDRPDIKDQIKGQFEKEQAYVCNSHARAHWYCIRKVHGKWYDLDSLKPAPVLVSDFALALTLENAMQGGFTVFVVRPKGEGGAMNLAGKFVQDELKLLDPEEMIRSTLGNKALQSHQHLLTDKDMDTMRKDAEEKERSMMANAERDFGGGGGDDEGGASIGQVFNPREKKQKEVDWGQLGEGNKLSAGSTSVPNNSGEDMDADMLAAIQASLNDVTLPEPVPQAADGLHIQVRFDSAEVKYIFPKGETTLADVCQWLNFAQLKENCFQMNPSLFQRNYALIKKDFPKAKKYVRSSDNKISLEGNPVGGETLEKLGFGRREALILQLE